MDIYLKILAAILGSFMLFGLMFAFFEYNKRTENDPCNVRDSASRYEQCIDRGGIPY